MGKELTTLFTGRNLLDLDSTDSTNTYLANLQKSGHLPEGSLVRAAEQVSGRGQGGSTWNSAAGDNLLLSFLFYPSFLPVRELFTLNKAYALSVFDLVSHHFPAEVKIKWPNDIYWKDKKVSGILVENILNTSGIQQSIFGTGININQEKFPENLPNPVSFFQIAGHRFDTDEEMYRLCNFLEQRYLQLRSGKYKVLHEEYKNQLYRLNEWKNYLHGEEAFSGKITGVDERGRLKVELENGEVRSFDLKEIRYL